MKITKELDKKIIELIKDAPDDLLSNIIGYDIKEYTFFINDVFLDKDDKNNIIFEVKDKDDNTGHLSLKDIDVDSKLKFMYMILDIINLLK